MKKFSLKEKKAPSKSLQVNIIATYILLFIAFLALCEFIVWQSLKYLALRNSKAYLEIISYRGSLLLRDHYADYLMGVQPTKGVLSKELFILKRSESLDALEDFLEAQGVSFAIWLAGQRVASTWSFPEDETPEKLKKRLFSQKFLFREIIFKPFDLYCLIGISSKEAIAPFQREIQIYLAVGFILAFLAMGLTFLLYRHLIGTPLRRLTQGLATGDLPSEIGIREFDTLLRMVKKALEKERKLIESLAVSEKLAALGTLAGGYAHEFNNLLQIILGNLDVAETACRHKACDKVQQKLKTAREAALRGASLARKILSISRHEKGIEEVCDLGALLEELEEGLRSGLPKNVKFQVDTEHRLGVPLSSEKLRDIIVNLVSNARDALKDEGEIRIRAYAKGERVILEVSDTGTGMDEETKKRIFDPFFTTKEPGKGTGLGLYAVYQLTDLAGGQIEVDSRSGEGTCFQISFPRAELPPPSPEKKEPHEGLSRSKSLRILVVDDEKEILENFRELFLKEGHEVDLASSAEEALPLLKAKSFDLVFVDLAMPGKGGVWLIREILRSGLTPKIIVMTGFAGKVTEEIEELKHQGKIYKVLWKPFDWKRIKEVLREVIY